MTVRWRALVPAWLFWSGSLLLTLAFARGWKFRLGPAQLPAFLGQDVALALAVAVVCRLICTARRSWMRIAGCALVTSVMCCLTLLGLVVVGVLSTPVTATLLMQATDLMFVQAALGDSAVASSASKVVAVAMFFPVVGTIIGALLDRRAAMSRRAWAAAVTAIAVALLSSRLASDSRYRDTNPVVTIVASSLGFAVEQQPEPVAIPAAEFQQRVAATGGPTETVPEIATLRPQRYDILLYVLETGVADVMKVDDPSTASWLPEIHRLAREGIVARRHVTTYANSTNSIFSIVASRYPYPDVQSVVRSAPRAPYETFPSILGRNGYRTAVFASIDNSYDRMSAFLSAHGFDQSGDRDSLHLRHVGSVFGSDWDLARRYLRWLDQSGSAPTLMMLLPSNSHWPFSSHVRRFNGHSRMDAYRNAVAEQDQILGMIRRELAARGRLDRTIIVLVPDHGAYFGLTDSVADAGSGLRVYHVPLIISHPQLRARKRSIRINSVTSHVDLGPTLLDLVGAPRLAADAQGVSWMRSWPARVVFWTDPTSDSIGATDGSTIARWHPHDKKTEFFAWTDTSTSKTSDVPPDVREKMQMHLDLFRRYQFHYLRALTR